MGAVKQPNAAGIDKAIQGFQKTMYDKLKAAWQLQDTDWLCYDRAYKNQNEDGAYYPEVFDGNNSSGNKAQDYHEVMFEDTVKLQSFFGIGETIKNDGITATVSVFLIFMINNLPALKPGLINRADEAVRIDAQRACVMPRYGFFMTGLTLGVENVFKEYNGWRKKEGIKHRDMHPFHCFRVNFNVVYNIQDC